MSGGSFERFFRMSDDSRHRRPSGRLWNPAADVYRTRDGWLVKVDLAGVRSEDVEITLDGPLLRISGLRRDSFCGEGVSHYQLEITYSRFEKIIQFPSSIESATVERDYRDGLLVLHLHENEECREELKTRAAGNR
jgi:HSP20 family protein